MPGKPLMVDSKWPRWFPLGMSHMLGTCTDYLWGSPKDLLIRELHLTPASPFQHQIIYPAEIIAFITRTFRPQKLNFTLQNCAPKWKPSTKCDKNSHQFSCGRESNQERWHRATHTFIIRLDGCGTVIILLVGYRTCQGCYSETTRSLSPSLTWCFTVFVILYVFCCCLYRAAEYDSAI